MVDTSYPYFSSRDSEGVDPFVDETLKEIKHTDLNKFRLDTASIETTLEKRQSGASGDVTSPSDSHVEEYEEKPQLEGSDDAEADPEKQEKDTLEKSQSTASVADDLSIPRQVLFIGTVCLAQLMTQASFGQVLALLHIIGDSFDITDPTQLTWLIAGYSLTVGTFILVGGRLGDVFGHKRIFICGFLWFAVWSTVCGFAVYSNSILFTFARVLQGMGPAVAFPTAIAIFGQSYSPGPKKAIAFSLFAACAPTGSVIGSAVAGAFALVWWPWSFWSHAIGLLGSAVLAYYVIPPQPQTPEMQKPFREKIKELDILGGLIGVTSLILFNFSWNQAPIVGWHEPYVITTLILGVLLAPTFFWYELKISKTPLIPFGSLSSDFLFVLGCVACGWGAFGIWVFYIWQIFEELRRTGPLLGAAYLAPAIISGTSASLFTAWLLGKIRPAWVMVFALCAFETGITLIATVPPDQIYWGQIFVCTLIMPFGMDMSFPASTLLLSNATDKKHQGIAASLVATVVNYSISLALGFAGTVEVNIEPDPKTPAEILRSYRSALYLGVGIAGLGIVTSVVFLVKSYVRDRKKQ